MKKRIAILSALLLMTGCTGNVTPPGSQPSQSSQISQTSQTSQPSQSSQTSQSEQSVTAPKESTPESSAQAEATAEPPRSCTRSPSLRRSARWKRIWFSWEISRTTEYPSPTPMGT